MIRSYRDLIVWQKAMDLAEAAYQLTAAFPREESTALRLKFADQRDPYLPTSPKGTAVKVEARTFSFCASLKDR